jgi:hypothetical protein
VKSPKIKGRSAIKVLFVIFSGLSVLFWFQNCAKLNTDSPNSVKVLCQPKDKPCLRYLLIISNLKNTKGGMSVLVQGDPQEGVTVNTNFSSQCGKLNATTALCPFDSFINATIRSDSTNTTVKGDGRSLTLRVPTTSTIKNDTQGPLSKKMKSLGSLSSISDDSICFKTFDDQTFYDGENIPLSAFVSCPSTGN